MLTFNQRGLLVPYEAISSTLKEMEIKLVLEPGTPKRNALFNQYLEYCTNLKHLLQVDTMRQWINGSFTTNKLYPRDIDLVTFIDYELVEKLGANLFPYKYPVSEIEFNVDAYIVTVYPKNHPKCVHFKSDEAYWFNRFTRTRPNRTRNNHTKGFLEINY